MKLTPPSYVKAYLKRRKNDAAWSTGCLWKRKFRAENLGPIARSEFSRNILDVMAREKGDPVIDDARPLARFAGICPNWTSVRKVKEGDTRNDLFGFLTTEPNDVVAPIHAKAMPVTPDEAGGD